MAQLFKALLGLFVGLILIILIGIGLLNISDLWVKEQINKNSKQWFGRQISILDTLDISLFSVPASIKVVNLLVENPDWAKMDIPMAEIERA